MQIAAETGEGRVPSMGQFHGHQLLARGARLEFRRHVVMEDPYATARPDPPVRCQPGLDLARVQRLLRGEAALARAGVFTLPEFAKVPLEQVAIDQGIAVVEGQ